MTLAMIAMTTTKDGEGRKNDDDGQMLPEWATSLDVVRLFVALLLVLLLLLCVLRGPQNNRQRRQQQLSQPSPSSELLLFDSDLEVAEAAERGKAQFELPPLKLKSQPAEQQQSA